MTIKALIATLLLLTGMTLAQTVTVTGTVDDPNGAPYSNGNGVATLVSGNGSGSQSWTTGGTNPVNPTRPISGFDSFGKFSIDLTNTAAIDQQSAQPVWVFNLCSNVNTVPSQLCFKLPGLALTVSQDITTQINSVPPPALPGSGGSCGPNCYPWINAGHFTGSDIGARVNAASATCVPNQPCHITIPSLGQQTFTTTITYVPNMTLECSPSGAAAEQTGGAAVATLLKYTGSGTAINFNGVSQPVLRNCSLDMSGSSGSAVGVDETGSSPIVDSNYFIGGPVGTTVVHMGVSDGAQLTNNTAMEFLGSGVYIDHAIDSHLINDLFYGARPGGISNTTSVSLTIDSGASGVHIQTFDGGSSGLHGLWVKNDIPHGSGFPPPAYIFIDDLISDCPYGDAWLFDSTLSVYSIFVTATNSWPSGAGINCDGTSTIRSVAQGIHISGGSNYHFKGMIIRANAYNGILVDNGVVQDVSVTDSEITGNNVANDSDSHGVYASQFLTGLLVSGNTITNNYQTLPNGHQRYAVKIGGNGTDIRLTNNDVNGNVTGAFSYPVQFGIIASGNTEGNTAVDTVLGGNVGSSVTAQNGMSPWMVPQFGTTAGFLMGSTVNMFFDGTNFHFRTDTAQNGGSGWLGVEDGTIGLYSVPTNGTPASDQTISAAVLAGHKLMSASPTGGVTIAEFQGFQFLAANGTGADCGAKINSLLAANVEVLVTSACGALTTPVAISTSNTRITFAPGVYTSGGITMSGAINYVVISCQGLGTTLSTATAGQTMITIGDGSNSIGGVTVDGCVLRNSAGSPTGFGISVAKGNTISLHNIQSVGFRDSLNISGGTFNAKLDTFTFSGYARAGIYIANGTGGASLDFFASNGSINASGGNAGIQWIDGSGVYASNISILNGANSVLISPTTGNAALAGKFTNVLGDTSSGAEFEIAPQNNGIVQDMVFTNCWAASSTGSNGVNIGGTSTTTIDGVEWANGTVKNNSHNGISLDGGGTTFNNIKVTGGTVFNNSMAGSASFSGISVAANVSGFSIVGVNSAAQSLSSNLQGFGIGIASGSSDNYVISGNNLLGNVSGALVDGGSGVNKSFSGNIPTAINDNAKGSGAPAGSCRNGAIYTRTDVTGGLYVCVNTTWTAVTIP